MALRTGALTAYLRALRDRDAPVDVDRVAAFGMPWPTPSISVGDEKAAARWFLDTVRKRLLRRLSESDRVLVRHHLFTPGNFETRAARAVEALRRKQPKVPDSYYRNHLGDALTALALALLEELQEELPVGATPSAPDTHASWYDVVEATWELAFDPSDIQRQHWRFTYKVHCRYSAQPIVAIPLDWSGTGDHEVPPTCISGRDRRDNSHEFLRCRPETQNPGTWDVYLFDLGTPLVPGGDDTLAWEMTLYDRERTFMPMIYRRTHDKPALRRLTNIVRCPSPLKIRKARAYREELRPETGAYVPVPPVRSVRVRPGGTVRQVVTDFQPDSRYVLRWEH